MCRWFTAKCVRICSIFDFVYFWDWDSCSFYRSINFGKRADRLILLAKSMVKNGIKITELCVGTCRVECKTQQ